jgi:hypothetical protein
LYFARPFRKLRSTRLIVFLAARISDKIQSILRAAGLKVATQEYEYTSSGISHRGENIYAIIQAPRGDATEAIVLVAAWKTVNGELNLNGVTLALTLARYFKRALFGLMPSAFFSLTDTIRLVFMVKGYHFRSAS